MRRLRAAATPAAFFIGLSLICASLIEYARWPYVSLIGFSDDFAPDLETAWVFDATAALQDAVVRLNDPRPFWAQEGFWVGPREVVGWLMLLGLVGGLASLALVVARRHRLGAWLLGGFTLLGLSPAIVMGLEYRVISWTCRSFCCDGSDPSSPIPPLLFNAIGFALAMAVLIAVAWMVVQHQAGLPLNAGTWMAAGVAISLLGLALHYADAAARPLTLEAIQNLPWPRPEVSAPDRPTLELLGLLGVGLLLSLRSPLYVSRFVSTLVLLTGLVLAIPAAAVIHDEDLARRTNHEGYALPFGDADPLPTIRCEPMVLAESIDLSALEWRKSISDRSLEDLLTEELTDQRKQWVDLHVQLGEPVPAFLPYNLKFDRNTPVDSVRTVLRAVARIGASQVNINSRRVETVPMWTRPTIHRHSCSLPIELSDDGRPLSEFPDWPSLVRAADEGKGTLHLRVD